MSNEMVNTAKVTVEQVTSCRTVPSKRLEERLHTALPLVDQEIFVLVRFGEADRPLAELEKAPALSQTPKSISLRKISIRKQGVAADLLSLLRQWWTLGRQQGVMHRDGWLFPGQHALKPISTRQLQRIGNLPLCVNRVGAVLCTWGLL